MAITVDATVARWTGLVTNGGTAASASFSPPNGSLLVVCINADENPGPNTATPSGGGWTYTSRVARGQTDSTEGLAEIWTAPVVTGASMSITITRGGEVANRRISGKVYIVTGQHASPIGNSNEASWTTNPQTLSVTAAGAGRLFGCGTDWNQTGTPVSTDTEDGADYTGQISVMSAFKAADHVSGSQGIQFDPVGTPTGNVVVLEILAAAGGGGALTGSSGITFTPAGTLTGTGALAGSSAITFSPTATLVGTAPISGTATLTFSPTGTLTGAGALSGSAAIAFLPTGTLTGAGALTGSATVTFDVTGTLAEAGSDALTGSTAFVFTAVGTLTGTGELAGSTTLTFSAAGVLTDASAPPAAEGGDWIVRARRRGRR